MRRLLCLLAAITQFGAAAYAADTPPAPEGANGEKPKENANPCRDEVAAALQKLRKSSWFRMNSDMITENGPTTLQAEYILPDKMHQVTTVTATKQTLEVILIGRQAWQNDGKGWEVLPDMSALELASQMHENVVDQQAEVGNYSCKGKMKVDGRDVMGYKLEDEPQKGAEGPKNEAFRMFYVDATTGLPSSNELVTPGREGKPFFKTSFTFPLDIKIEPPKDAKPVDAAASAAKPEGENKK